MKKIMFTLALALVCAAANAQISTAIADAKANVEAKEAAAENPKKAAKPKTWLDLANAYLSAYTAPQGGAFVGQNKTETLVIMGKEKKPKVSTVKVLGQPMEKYAYSTVAIYFAQNGNVGFIDILKPVYKDALSKALNGYKKAYELDTKGKSKKQIEEGLNKIVAYYTEAAFVAYQIGNLKKASSNFESAYKAGLTEPISKKDAELLYNAGFTAFNAKDYSRAKKLFNSCLKEKYYGENGDVYAKLAEIANQNEDKAAGAAEAKKILQTGFEKFPQSQSILIGLINYYVSSGDDTAQLFALIDKAKVNEPNNASLYYVEGNIYGKLGDTEKAVASYRKCSEINPKYEYGYVGEGVMFYDAAVNYQTKANAETDNDKYAELAKQFEVSLRSCVEPFEKAFEVTADKTLKAQVAEYLKNACFRFRTEPEMQAKYDKYSQFVADSKK